MRNESLSCTVANMNNIYCYTLVCPNKITEKFCTKQSCVFNLAGYPVSGCCRISGRISGIRLLKLPDIRQAGYPVNSISGTSLVTIVQVSELSFPLAMEPAERQAVTANLPVTIKPADLSLYEEDRLLCGFGELGSTDTNYKHCLVRVVLRPEYRPHLELVKSDMTVQVRG